MLSLRDVSCGLLLPLIAASPSLGGTTSTILFDLSGSQEAPPTPSPATGGCMGVLDEGAATFALTCSHNVSSPTLIHIHRGAIGANGPVVFDLGAPESPVTATWTSMTATDISEVKTGALYVNLHSAGRADGEIRGQVRELFPDFFTFPLDGSQQVPPDTSTATGECIADLSADRTMLSVACSHDVADPTAAHIHFAPAGENGPVELEFADPADPADTKTMTALDVSRFVAGFFYVNIHSPSGMGEPGGGDPGEIRGQMIPGEVFVDGFESGDTLAWSVTVP